MNPNEIKLIIAKNLRKYRELNNYTQKQLADELSKRLGITLKHNSVSSWESGTNSIDVAILFEICRIFNISINEMYEVVEKPTIIAAHFEGEEFTEEELNEINNYIQFVISKRKNK